MGVPSVDAEPEAAGDELDLGPPVPGGGVTARNAKSRLGFCDCFQPVATVIVFTGHDP